MSQYKPPKITFFWVALYTELLFFKGKKIKIQITLYAERQIKEIFYKKRENVKSLK
jgi:hypothetical protein